MDIPETHPVCSQFSYSAIHCYHLPSSSKLSGAVILQSVSSAYPTISQSPRSISKTWHRASIPWAPTSMRNFRDRALSARHASLRSSSKVEDCTRSTSLSTLKTSKSEIMLPAFIVQFSEHESPYNKLN